MSEPAVIPKQTAAAPKKFGGFPGGAAKKFGGGVKKVGLGVPQGDGVANGGGTVKVAPHVPPRAGTVGGGGVGVGVGVGGPKKVGAKFTGSGSVSQPVNGVQQQQQQANGASPMRTRGLPDAPTMADGGSTTPISTQYDPTSNPQDGSEQWNGDSSSSSTTTTTSSTTQIPESSSLSGTEETSSSSSAFSSTTVVVPQHSDVYVQKSFRSTVNVDIAALRKGPSTLNVGMGGSSSPLSGGGSNGNNLASGGSPSPGPNGNVDSNLSSSLGGAPMPPSSSSMEFPTPSNASKRIEESFSNPIFSKVEIQIKSKRDNAAYEILTTEQSYCKSLTVLNELYRLPLLEACKRGLFPSISEDLITDIFSRFFVDISRVNFVLLQGLVERFTEWDDRQSLGDLLLDLLPFLKMYTMYTGNYERSMAALTELESNAKEGSHLANFLAEIHSNPIRTLDLRSYLIMPIQRTPRYRLLLEELIKNTTPEHPDWGTLHKALESIKLVAAQIDAAIHEQKNRAKMLEIQDSFFGEKVQIIEAGRMFVKEGEMGKVCRKDTQKRFVWLFNDLFLYAKQLPSSSRYSKHRAFPLKSIRVKDLMDDGKIYKHAIQIASEKKSFVLLANSGEEKALWMAEFAKAISEQENKIRIDGQSINSVAPVWVPDSEALRCMICGDKFTLMQRRHHCRQCGNVVCSKCSAKKKELPGQGKKRVCDSCYTKSYSDSNSLSPSPSPQQETKGSHVNTSSNPTTATTNIGGMSISPNTNSLQNGSSPTLSTSPGYTNNTQGVATSTSTVPSTNGSSSSTSSPTSTTQTSTQPRVSEMFRAAYDYEPPVENPKKKLAFKAGDVMEITIKNDPGWWFAVMGDTKGWVPASFLEPMPSRG
jgi:hypothetical protein